MQRHKTRHLMGTDVTISIFGEENPDKDIQAVFDLFYVLEREFSRFLPDSSLSKLNNKRSLEVSDTFIDIIRKCREIYTATDFYFNPLINLRQIGYSKSFHKNEFKKEDEQVKVNLHLESIKIQGNTIILQEGQNLDLGGIVKGYGVDKAKEYLERKGYTNYIIDAGGDIFTAEHNNEGEKMLIGIDSPFTQGNIFATIEVENFAIATSGIYKRKWEIDNQEYNHIINPLTANNTNEIISITLLAEECYLADAYATACIAMGLEKTLAFLKKHHLEGVILCTNKKVYVTSGMKKYNIQYI